MKPRNKVAFCLSQIFRMERRKGFYVLFIGAVLLVLQLTIAPASAITSSTTYHINDTGGDCAAIGTWNSPNKTCTLTTDITFSGVTGISIESDNVTLDGDGHTLTGDDASIVYGVALSGRAGVTIKDLTVTGFWDGIYLFGSGSNTLTGNTTASNASYGIYVVSSSDNTLTGNTASNNSFGIYLMTSNSNTLTGNTASSNYYGGINLYGSSSNTLTGNTASNNVYGFSVGIQLDSSSSSNTLTGNTASNNDYGIFLDDSSSSNILTGNTASSNTFGIILHNSSNNQIYHNNFLGNTIQASVSGGSGNLFYLPAPNGGNYWSDFHTPAQGCNDTNPADGFCDAAYTFSGGQDDLPSTALYSTTIYHIIDNATGGDCVNAAIGTWDAPTKTCTLSNDITFSGVTGISIESDNVTLDGAGHKVTGDNVSVTAGVSLNGRSGVTVKNLTARRFYAGIYIASSSNNTLTGNTVSSNINSGIYLYSSNSNTLTGNTASSNLYGTYLATSSNNNILTGNTVSNSGNYGICLASSSNSNTLTGNTVSNSGSIGIYLSSSNSNQIYHNNFLSNTPQASVYSGSGNLFSLPAPDGGNFWSNFDTPGEGCSDSNSDGFCDAAYAFSGGQDDLPWTRQNGWNQDYYWTWYDNVGGDNWVLLANPAGAASNLTFNLTIAGILRTLPGGGVVAPGQSITPSYPGLIGGPVKASATPAVFGGSGVVSQRILWPKGGGNSLEEVLGVEESKLSDHFWWTWYDQMSPGFTNWVLIANPSATETVHAVVSFTNQADGLPVTAGSDILPGENWNPTFVGKMGGPVEIKAYLATGSWPANARDVIASQRALTNYGSAFNEVPGIPDGELTDHYLWTWYDQSSPGFTNWVLVANPSATETVHAVVSFTNKSDGTPVTAASDILPGQNWTPTFPGKMGGPVEVKAYLASGTWPADRRDVIASQRSLAGPSFEEVPGYPYNALAGDYHWTWYDQLSTGVTNWVLVANPSATETVHAVVSFTNKSDGTPVTAESDILPGQNWTPTFPGKMGGPVEVKAYLASGTWPADERSVIASQRVLWNGYFNEVLGTVVN